MWIAVQLVCFARYLVMVTRSRKDSGERKKAGSDNPAFGKRASYINHHIKSTFKKSVG